MATDAESTLIQAFDRLSTGVLVLDPQGRVVRANPLAVAMLDSCSELSLVGKRLVSSCAETADTIEERIRTVTRGGEGPEEVFLEVLGDGAEPSLLLRFVASLPAPAGFDTDPDEPERRNALVFLSDGRSSVDREALRRVHGLTRAEAQLASGLVAGLNLAEAAQSRGVEIETTRTQLKAVLRKVGARSQADLVRRLLTGVARVSDPARAEESRQAPSRR